MLVEKLYMVLGWKSQTVKLLLLSSTTASEFGELLVCFLLQQAAWSRGDAARTVLHECSTPAIGRGRAFV